MKLLIKFTSVTQNTHWGHEKLNLLQQFWFRNSCLPNKNTRTLTLAFLYTQQRWEGEIFTTDCALYPNMTLPAITMLTKVTLKFFTVCKVDGAQSQQKCFFQTLILLQCTSLKTHILCDTAVIIQPSTCRPVVSRDIHAATYTERLTSTGTHT